MEGGHVSEIYFQYVEIEIEYPPHVFENKKYISNLPQIKNPSLWEGGRVIIYFLIILNVPIFILPDTSPGMLVLNSGSRPFKGLPS